MGWLSCCTVSHQHASCVVYRVASKQRVLCDFMLRAFEIACHRTHVACWETSQQPGNRWHIQTSNCWKWLVLYINLQPAHTAVMPGLGVWEHG